MFFNCHTCSYCIVWLLACTEINAIVNKYMTYNRKYLLLARTAFGAACCVPCLSCSCNVGMHSHCYHSHLLYVTLGRVYQTLSLVLCIGDLWFLLCPQSSYHYKPVWWVDSFTIGGTYVSPLWLPSMSWFESGVLKGISCHISLLLHLKLNQELPTSPLPSEKWLSFIALQYIHPYLFNCVGDTCMYVLIRTS